MNYIEQHEINKEFLKAFPLEKLNEMTLEQYSDLNSSDYFCYWVERKTKILGSVSGNTSFKFGIYRYSKAPEEKRGTIHDDKYAWYSSLGKTASEAFENVKRAVIKAAEGGFVGDLDAIESIKVLGPMIKWKIAFLYSNESIIPYYSLDRLRVIGEKMGMTNAKDATIAEIQKYLIDKRNGRDIHEYGKMLDDVWKNNDTTPNSDHAKVWMYKRYEDAFSIDYIRMGSDAKGKLDFSSFRTKKSLGDAYRRVVGNTDVAVPNMYWQLIKEVNPGDIVVVFDSLKGKGSKVSHLLYGWGKVTSDVYFDKNDDNPIHRNVIWHKPLPKEPIEENMTSNTRYFHEVKGIEAANIMELLGIKGDEVMSTKKDYWLSGYYIDEKSELDDFIAKNEWRAWFGEGDANQLNDAKSIQKGDILILKSTLTKGKKHNLPCMRIKAVAVVESDMETLSGRPGLEGVRYKVRFINKEDKDFDGSSFGSYRRTIQQCRNKDIIAYVESLLPDYMEDKKKYQEFIDLLEANKNLILTGAPGTGKTYLAKAIAEEMGAECEFVQFHPSYDYTDFVEGLRPIQENAGEVGFERRDGVFKEFCARALQNWIDSKKSLQALQQESSVRDLLEDFIEEALEKNTQFETSGTKNTFYIIDNKEKSIIVKVPANEKTSEVALPKSDLTTLLENNVPISGGKEIQAYFHRKYRTQQDSYVYVLYNLLRKKKAVPGLNLTVDLIPEKKFVFIIDEINRGEISKIFGELFFSIDPGYRGIKGRVKTQYQNLIEEGDAFKDGFYVPENVYIIGTMNDIDRSVESMDFAMRRRFAWKEVTAEDSMKMLDGTEYEEEAKKRMQNLNAAIIKVRGLGKAYQIGAAYFKKIKDYNGDFQKLWDFHLKGLLYEYLRGNMNAEEQLEELKKAYES